MPHVNLAMESYSLNTASHVPAFFFFLSFFLLVISSPRMFHSSVSHDHMQVIPVVSLENIIPERERNKNVYFLICAFISALASELNKSCFAAIIINRHISCIAAKFVFNPLYLFILLLLWFFCYTACHCFIIFCALHSSLLPDIQ